MEFKLDSQVVSKTSNNVAEILSGAQLKEEVETLSTQNEMLQRINLRKLSLDKRKELSRKSDKFSDLWRDATAHSIDDDILSAFYIGKPKHTKVFNDFDVSLDGIGGFYFIEWTDADVNKLNAWMVKRSLRIMRFAHPTNNLFLEELQWYCSQHFDDVCLSIKLNANDLRTALPKIIAQYHESLPEEAQLILDDFTRLKNILNEDVDHVDAEYVSDANAYIHNEAYVARNEVSSYEDSKYLKHCIEGIRNTKMTYLDHDVRNDLSEYIDSVNAKFGLKILSFNKPFSYYAKEVLQKAGELHKVKPKKTRKRKVGKRMSKKQTVLNSIATDLLLAAETLEELYDKVGPLTAFKVELLTSKAKEIISSIKKAKFKLDTEAIDLSNLAEVLKEFCEKEDRKVSFKMGLIADKVISLSKQLDKL